MSPAPDQKPRPARLPEVERPGNGRPGPARELVPRAAETAGAGAAPGELEPDAEAVVLEAEGGTWRVGVLGRSGGVGSRSPPLLILGFRRDGAPADETAREAVVVARALREVTESRLEEALSRAVPPPASDRRKPFFETATANRRSGGPARRED